MAGKPTKKNTQQTSDQFHHPQCSFVALPRVGCECCELLYAVDQGRQVLRGNEAMETAVVRFQETLIELEISLREESERFRASDSERMKKIRARKEDEAERVDEARTACIAATRRRTRLVVLQTDGHTRLARKVKTTANKLEKDGRLPRDLAQHLYAFAKRVAFVVGVDRYDSLPSAEQLQKAVADARTMSETFKALGYEVISAENSDRRGFNESWQKFLSAIEPGDEAAFFFSGHGVEIGGLNYLLPRDVPKPQSGQVSLVKSESLSVTELLSDLQAESPRVSLVILDASIGA